MAFTREQTQALLDGSNDGHFADAIANPSFDTDARKYGVELLIDRQSRHATRQVFAHLVILIKTERAAAAAEIARLAEEAKAAEETAKTE